MASIVESKAGDEPPHIRRSRLSSTVLVERRLDAKRAVAIPDRVVGLLDQVADSPGPFHPEIAVPPRRPPDRQACRGDRGGMDQALLDQKGHCLVHIQHRWTTSQRGDFRDLRSSETRDQNLGSFCRESTVGRRIYAFPGLRPEKWPPRGSPVGAGSVRRFRAGDKAPSYKRPR